MYQLKYSTDFECLETVCHPGAGLVFRSVSVRIVKLADGNLNVSTHSWLDAGDANSVYVKM